MIPGYASILHNHLKDEETNQQLFDGVDLEIDHHKHKPNQVKNVVSKLMICMIQKITGDQLIILNEVKSFTDICGACER
jgi:putative membrane protein